MRMGLLADIHEDVERLASAIERCRSEGADRLLTLGDIFQDGGRFAETVDLLRQADVAGVWGNHEFGICHDPGAWVERQFSRPILGYMGRLRPRLEVEGVLLGHVLPGLDPTDVQQPWYVERAPETAEAAAPHFAAFPHRRMFVGHYHRWLAVTPGGALPWSGESPIAFDPDRRYLLVVAAVCDGFCAIYDTETDVVTPYNLRPASGLSPPSG
jgi:hypothetical protein